MVIEYILKAYHYKLVSKRKLNNKLSLVYMYVMEHMATKFGHVPFNLDLISDTPHKEEYNLPNPPKGNPNLDLYSYKELMKKVAENGWRVDGEKNPIEHKDIIYKKGDTAYYKIPDDIYRYIFANFIHLSANYNSKLAGFYSEHSQLNFVNAPNFTFKIDDHEFKNPPYKRDSYNPILDAYDTR